MLSNVSVPLLGVVDTAVVGRLPGPEYIGAVAVGALIIDMIFWAFGFLRMGAVGHTAQAMGAEDSVEMQGVFFRSILIAGVIGLMVLVLQTPFLWAALEIIEPGEKIGPLVESYFNIRIWGAPAVLANYAVLGWLLGMQAARAVLVLQICVNGLNMALDILFVMEFGWGVEGVAAATVIAQVSGLCVGLLLVRRRMRAAKAPPVDWSRIINWPRIRALLATNRDLFIRTVCMMAAFTAFTKMGARMGEAVLAANAVLFLFFEVMAYALDGFADAANTLSGHAYGARDRARFWDGFRKALLWAGGFSCVFAALYLAAGDGIVALITTVPEVRAQAGEYIVYIAAMPVVAVWAFHLDGVFIGLSRGADMRNAMIISVLGYFALLWFLAPRFGNDGLWWAMLAYMALRGVTLALRLPALDRAFRRSA
ncbi:MAG: MATE family efflux transporter [Rhodospirillales bacterium]